MKDFDIKPLMKVEALIASVFGQESTILDFGIRTLPKKHTIFFVETTLIESKAQAAFDQLMAQFRESMKALDVDKNETPAIANVEKS